MTKMTISISGMTCGHCLRSVDGALRSLADLNIDHLKVGSATVSFDETRLSTEQIVAAIAKAGYQVSGLQPAAAA